MLLTYSVILRDVIRCFAARAAAQATHFGVPVARTVEPKGRSPRSLTSPALIQRRATDHVVSPTCTTLGADDRVANLIGANAHTFTRGKTNARDGTRNCQAARLKRRKSPLRSMSCAILAGCGGFVGTS